jgi:multicomponent Na+:H+ antiporter subunit B
VIVSLDLAVFVILLLTALLALRVRDLLTAVALLAGYSLFAAVLFTGVSALDVALVEAALGAGITGVLFIAAILATTRRSTASESPRQRAFVLVLIAAFLGLMLFASIDLPDRGDPEAAAHVGISTAYLEGSLEDTETPNVVTALLADYRSMDTLGETLVILTAAIAAALVLIRRPEDEGEPAAAAEDDGDPAATAEDESDPVTGRVEGS